MISERAHRRKPLAAARCNGWRALVAVMMALFAACTFAPVENGPQTPVSGSLTQSDGFTNFETEPVSPLVLSADGRYLYAPNTADDRLEIFAAQGKALRSMGETTVGLRLVALALHGPRVTHTLQVGDERSGRGWRDYQNRDWTPAVSFELPD